MLILVYVTLTLCVPVLRYLNGMLEILHWNYTVKCLHVGCVRVKYIVSLNFIALHVLAFVGR